MSGIVLSLIPASFSEKNRRWKGIVTYNHRIFARLKKIICNIMKILPTANIRQVDAYTIEHEPVTSIELMERAAKALAEAVVRHWDDREMPVVVFAGPGNNGGDALAVSRLLASEGYTHISVYLFNPKDRLSDDCRANRDRLVAEVPDVEFQEVGTQFVPPVLSDRHLVIDGLFGSGLDKPLGGGFAAVVKYVNASSAQVVSIDMPSGLMGEDNTYNSGTAIIKADVTLSLQLPKLSFLFAENAVYTGEWDLLDIGLSEEAIDEADTSYYLTEPEDVKWLLKLRQKFAHKGDFGRALLIAGSKGMAGASVLAAKACLRSGVGLLKVHVPACNNVVMQTAVPEAMTEQDYSDAYFSTSSDADNIQALGIGPGLGQEPETELALVEQIETTLVPMVVDADALNLLAGHRDHLMRLPKGSILTPHPKELERLVGKCQNSYERLVKARELAREADVHIVLKGAYSAVITPEGNCHFNTTGNPGMATGGSGDVLTGVLLALLAQGYAPRTAALLGTYVHGLAGDLAAHKFGQTAMTAGDIVDSLPAAWKLMEGAE